MRLWEETRAFRTTKSLLWLLQPGLLQSWGKESLSTFGLTLQSPHSSAKLGKEVREATESSEFTSKPANSPGLGQKSMGPYHLLVLDVSKKQ